MANKLSNWDGYSCVACTEEQRQRLGELLNLTDAPEDRWLWRLTDYVLFARTRNWDKKLPASLPIMRDICGFSKKSWRICAYDRLAEWQSRTGIEIAYDDYVTGQTARAITTVCVNKEILMLADEIRNPRTPLIGRVQFDTGKKITGTMIRRIREHTQVECMAAIAEAGNEDAQNLLRYLNELPGNRWSQVSKFIPQLREIARDTEDCEYTLNVLLRIEQLPQPFYVPGVQTQRIFAAGANVLNLPRAVRKELFRLLEWHTFDLKAAQLAILSVTWNIPSLQTYLENGGNFWQDQINHMGYQDEDKDIIKEALYALAFGAGKDRMMKIFVREKGAIDGKNDFDRWLSHPLIEDIFNARAKVMADIRSRGSATDCYGREYKVTAITAKSKTSGYHYQDTNVRSILACLAQAWELKLLSPVLDVIQHCDRRVQLAYWLHDGFGISCPESLKYVLDQLLDRVNENIRSLGFPTQLVLE